MDLDAKRTALIVLDLQGGTLDAPFAPHSALDVVRKSAELAQAVRDSGGTVVLVNVGFSSDFADAPKQPVDSPMSGSPPGKDWFDFPPELGPKANDIVVTKRQWGAFHGTELDLQLRRRGIETIILAGFATNLALESTARGGWERGYNIIIAEDACASFSGEMHKFAVDCTFPLIGHVRYAATIAKALSNTQSGPFSGDESDFYGCFKGRNAIVTGGGHGVGAAVALELAKLGANVVIVDQDIAAAKATAAQIDGLSIAGVKALAIEADISDITANSAAVTETLKAFGSLHLAVNSTSDVKETNLASAAWQNVMATDLDGAFYSIKHQAPAIVRSGGGAIVSIGSVYGRIGHADKPAYSAAKHGLLGITRSSALEYARQGVRINVVSPGLVQDAGEPDISPAPDQMWIGRAARPAEIAQTVVFLLSDMASYMVGAELLADGGMSLE